MAVRLTVSKIRRGQRDQVTIKQTYLTKMQFRIIINNNAIDIAQIHAQQQMGCRVISVQTERLSA